MLEIYNSFQRSTSGKVNMAQPPTPNCPPGIRWANVLTRDGRPILLLVAPGSRLLRMRPLEEGEDPDSVIDELRASAPPPIAEERRLRLL